MGKGDQRSRRGKIHRGTYGKRRPRKKRRERKLSQARPEASAGHAQLMRDKPGGTRT